MLSAGNERGARATSMEREVRKGGRTIENRGKVKDRIALKQRFFGSPFFAEQLLEGRTCLKTQFRTRTVKTWYTQNLQQRESHPVI